MSHSCSLAIIVAGLMLAPASAASCAKQNPDGTCAATSEDANALLQSKVAVETVISEAQKEKEATAAANEELKRRYKAQRIGSAVEGPCEDWCYQSDDEHDHKSKGWFVAKFPGQKPKCNWRACNGCRECTQQLDLDEMIPFSEMVASESSTSGYGDRTQMALTSSPRKFWPGTCTNTNYEPNPWWKVTLSGTYRISKVKLTNRANCCMYWCFANCLVNVNIYVDGMMCAEGVDVGGSSKTKEVPCSGEGSEIKVQLMDTSFPLTICGFEAYGAEMQTYDSPSLAAEAAVETVTSEALKEKEAAAAANEELKRRYKAKGR